jgi:hypothetical protein
MVETTWTFMVIFIAIFGVLIAFAGIWLSSHHQGPGSSSR